MVARGSEAKPQVEALRTLEHSLDIIASRVAMIAPLDMGANQRRRALDVPAELESFRLIAAPLLDESRVEMDVVAPRHSVLRVEMRPETLHRLLHILTVNSLEWLESKRDPRIRVVARPIGDRCEVVFSDNGPGISPAIADRVFDPLFSTKERGRGMGLTIARGLVELHGGRIAVLVDGRRRGANIQLLLPRKRSRATIHQ
jgi:C4-dicarboxylate-specific signal transduction histidine kinase